MSESNKKGPEEGDDWDTALEEWDEKAFSEAPPPPALDEQAPSP